MRLAKIFGAILGIVAALLVLGALVVAWLFDPNDYKGYVAELFETRTGRTLAIEQDLKLSYFPWLAVETGGVTVGNSAEFATLNEPFATAERAAARVRLLPLFSRRIEIGTVELEGLALNLARDAEGLGNWEDLLAPGAGETAANVPESPTETATGTLERLELEGVRIRDGVVYWRENTHELRYTVSGLSLDTGSISSGEPVDVELRFELRDATSALALELAAGARAELGEDGSMAVRGLRSDFTLDGAPSVERAQGRLQAANVVAEQGGRIRLDGVEITAQLTRPEAAPERLDLALRLASASFDDTSQTLEVEGLTTETAGITATWQLTGTALLDNAAVEGTVAVAESSLGALLDVLGLQPPQGVDRDALGNASLAAAFSFQTEPRRLRVSQIDARLLGARAQGELALDDTDNLRGRIDVPQFAATDNVRSLLRAHVPAEIDLSAIDRLALSARFDTNLVTGSAAIRDLEAELLGASLTGEVDIVPGRNGNIYRGSVATSRFAPDALVKAAGSLLSDKIDVRELGTVALNARFAYDTAQDSVTLAQFEAELFGLRGTGQLAGRGLSAAPAWSGQAKVAQFSPRDLMRRFGQPPPETSDPAALTRAAIDTRFEIDAAQGRFRNLVLELDGSRITGEFTVDGFRNPRYLFALAIDRVDADRYLPPPADQAAPGEKTAGDIELPTDSPLVIDGRVQVGQLRLAGLDFQEVATGITLGDGNAKLDSARAELYGGEFDGSFHATTSGAQPGLRLQGRANGLQLQPLIEALTREAANFSGTGSFEIDLAGRGGTVIENVETAGGNVSFALRDGTIKGFNLGRTLCSAYNATQKLAAPREQPKETRYQVVQGTATVANGIAQSPDLLARTSFMDISGRGSLGLVEQRLDYDLDAKLTGRIEIPGCESMEPLIGGSIPFDIRGTVTDPTITPDFSEIVKRRIENEVRDRVQDRLQDRLRDLIR
jgi:AsmA protein